jgi:hypothetical protein
LKSEKFRCKVRRSSTGAGRAAVSLAAYFQLQGASLSHALHSQPEGAVLYFGFQHSPNGVPFRRPQMQEAPVVLAGNGIFGLCKIECHGAVLEDNCPGSLAEKILHGSG